MFRSVEYAGFEGRSDLRERAVKATTVLAEELADVAGDCAVGWKYEDRQPSGIGLELDLQLPAASGRGERLIPLPAFGDEGELRSQFRRTALVALNDYFAKRRPVWAELSRATVGV